MNKLNATNRFSRQQNKPTFIGVNTDEKTKNKPPFVRIDLNKDHALGYVVMSLLWGAIMGNDEYTSTKKVNAKLAAPKSMRVASKAIGGFFAGMGFSILARFSAEKIKSLSMKNKQN